MLAVAFVVLLVAFGAIMAVPAARTAILDFFGLRGATVQRVETLPAVPRVPAATARALELGTPVSTPKFAGLLVPEALGAPDAVYFSPAVPGGKVSLVYEPGGGVPVSQHTGVGILVTEFRGDIEFRFVEKWVAGSTSVERLTVDGSPGLWVEGGPHFVLFRTEDGEFGEDSARLAGNTLLVERGSLLVRIEGDIDRERAVAIAESLEP